MRHFLKYGAFFFGFLLMTLFTGLGFSRDLVSDIRTIDFFNFIYPKYFDEVEGNPAKPVFARGKVKVKNGKYFSYNGEELAVVQVIYGDWNADSFDEAIVLLERRPGYGGNAKKTVGLVYTLQNGKPTLLQIILGGDRASGGIRNIAVQDQQVTIDYWIGSGCCSNRLQTVHYRLENNQLLEIKKDPIRTLRLGECANNPVCSSFE